MKPRKTLRMKCPEMNRSHSIFDYSITMSNLIATLLKWKTTESPTQNQSPPLFPSPSTTNSSDRSLLAQFFSQPMPLVGDIEEVLIHRLEKSPSVKLGRNHRRH